MERGVRRTPSLGLILLLSELYQVFSRNDIPPITLSFIIAQIVIFIGAIPSFQYSPSEACMSAYKIIYLKDYWKLLIAQVHHGNDWHLYYNMLSFMWKGKSLENQMSSSKYLMLLLMFTGATGITYVGLNYALAEYFQDSSYIYNCSVGFSGVLFALKVLTTHYQVGNQTVGFGPMTMSVNSKYVVWVELVLISVIIPNASFIGHLAGIIVGLAYVYGPLKPILDLISGEHGRRNSYTYFGSPRFTSTSQSTGYAQSANAARPTTSNYRNYVPPGMTEEEQLQRATADSVGQSYGWRATGNPDSTSTPATTNIPSQNHRYSSQPTQEELRRIRLQRFN